MTDSPCPPPFPATHSAAALLIIHLRAFVSVNMMDSLLAVNAFSTVNSGKFQFAPIFSSERRFFLNDRASAITNVRAAPAIISIAAIRSLLERW